ncbi:MAG: hypothetical protein ACTSRK_08190 [Promethearchaeota archaeon]
MVHSEYLIPMLYEFSISILAILIIIPVGKKYFSKKNPVLKSMLLFLSCLTLAVLAAAISRLLRFTGLWELPNGEFLELLAFTMSFIAISNIFLMDFGFKVFQKEDQAKRNRIYVILYGMVNVVFVGYTLLTGLFVVDLTTAIWGILVLISLVSFIQVSYLSFRLTRSIDNKKDRRAIQMIGLSPISMLLIFISFFIDRLMGGNFTVFYYIGWFFVLFVCFFITTGILRPKWFESR